MLALGALLLGARFLPESEGHAVRWQDLSSRVGPLVIVRSEERLFRNHAELAAYLREAKASRPPPRIAFSARQLLLLSPGPRSSTGYSVEVLSVRKRGDTITVRARERTPGLGAEAKPRVTYPYRLLGLPAGDAVYVDWLGR